MPARWKMILNADLRVSDVPPAGAKWDEIQEFALKFSGYEHWGSFGNCANVANDVGRAYANGIPLPEDLTVLRTCLFFEQRRWRHFGEWPDESAMRYIRSLVDAIREIVKGAK